MSDHYEALVDDDAAEELRTKSSPSKQQPLLPTASSSDAAAATAAVTSAIIVSNGLVIDDDCLEPPRAENGEFKFDVSVHGKSSAIALVLFVLSVIFFAVVGGLHATRGNDSSWSTALYALPTVLIVAAVIYVQNCRWRTLWIRAAPSEDAAAAAAAASASLVEFGVQCLVLPFYASTEISFENVQGVAIATTEVSALAMTHVKMDGVVLLWQDEYGATRETLLAFSVPFQARRRAAGWIRTLRNATGLEIQFDREPRALPM